MIDSIIDLLHCPLCARPVVVAERELRCPAGHGFDIARQGYVNLLTRPAKGANADTAEMIIARDRFLSAGHYRTLSDRLAELVADRSAGLPGGSPTGAVLLEAGAGTAHYLGRVLTAVDGARAIATDLSVPACRRAAGVDARLGAVVADTWSGLPINDAAVDLIMVVFAPRNPAEFARLLRPGGILLVAAANDDHLTEVRDQLGMINIRSGKLPALQSSLQEWFELEHSEDLRSPLSLDHAALQDLVLMGPTAHHRRTDLAQRIATLPDPTAVTLSVGLSVFRRR